jgi:hypothetical protein
MRKRSIRTATPGTVDPLEKASAPSRAGELVDALRAPLSSEGLHDDDLLPKSFQRAGKARERKSLMRAWEQDLDLVAMTWAMMQHVPRWQLEERERGRGNETNRTLLEQFFHRPDGRQSFQALLRLTAARYKLLGDSYYLLKKPNAEMEDLARRGRQLARSVVGKLRKTLPGLEGSDAEQLESTFREQFQRQLGQLENVPPGFEFLDGDVERLGDEYVQTISIGKSKTFPAERIIEFRSPSPKGGKFNLMKALRPWSDASVRVFQLNRAGAQTGGMADMLIAIDGISDTERKRLEARMMSRADPRRDVDQYLPMIVRAQSLDPDQRVRLDSAQLTQRERDAKWQEWDHELKKRKSGAMQVALSQVGEYRHVNRATKDQSKRDLVEEAVSITLDLCDTITERIIVETLGIEDWVLGIEEPDLRDAEFAHKQDMQDQESGVMSLWDRWVARHGVWYAEDMAERVAELIDEDTELVEARLKIPQVKVGKDWLPITDILPDAPVAADASEEAGAPAEPANIDTGAAGGSEENSGEDGPAGPPDEEGQQAGPDEMLAALDTWQKSTVEAMRNTGLAYDPAASVAALQVLPEGVHECIDQLLFHAETQADISNAFAPARKAIRAGRDRLAKIQLPQSQVRMFRREVGDIFAGVREDARRELQSAMRSMKPEFETEPGEPE